METITRKVNSGKEYDHFFPKATLQDITVKKSADLSSTLLLIPRVVSETLWQTKKIAKELEGDSVYETCKKVFEFAHKHITYKKDEDGIEQVRSPARAWHDRHTGIDCDCYTVFIASILTNLGIPVTFRVTKYTEENGFQHIYPIVPTGKGKHIILDCVVHIFNYEKKPILEKIDQKMELQYLNGIEEKKNLQQIAGTGEDLTGWEDLSGSGLEELAGLSGELGFLKKLRKSLRKITLRNVLNKLNRFNPATILLRNGLLASMKLNIMKVARDLRWSYLSDDQAKKKGVIAGRFSKLKSVKEKLENIFYAAGGKPENLRKAILKGKGNRDGAVSLAGFEALDGVEAEALMGYDESTPLSTLLGDIYHSENVQGLDGLGELGEPATATAIAAASGAVATIAALIKNIGSIFGKGQEPGAEGGGGGGGEGSSAADVTGGGSTDTGDSSETAEAGSSNKNGSKSSGAMDSVAGFWENNKSWIKPVAIGTGIIGAAYVGSKLLTKPKTTYPPVQPPQPLPASAQQPQYQYQPQSMPVLYGIKGKKKGGEKTIEKQKVAPVKLM